MQGTPLTFTPEQHLAVTTTGGSILVSAAAGSGKTAVLAERCAYLVCDAPPDQRCDVDALLVLTFTDAAAAQMRSRIVEAIRRRLEERPEDARLRRQLALVDAAQISTVHAFCLWLVRRWFTHVGVEPTAVIMDNEEASLLKKEVLSELFTQLYATLPATDDPLGGKEIEPPPDAPAATDDALSAWELGRRTAALLGPEFVRLIDDYGLGEDRDIAAAVLKIFEFTRSLPNPSEWLQESVESPLVRSELVLLEIAASLRTELERQVEHCAQLVETMRAGDPAGHFYAKKIAEYESALREWKAILEGGNPRNAIESLERFEAVRKQINGFEFNKERAKPLPKDADSGTRAARDVASDLYSEQVKKRLFQNRLKKRFGLFSVEEWIAGLQKTAPYVATLVDVVAAFEDAYFRRKRRLNVLDFADLERFAHDLLRPVSGVPGPSEVARSLQDRFAHVLVDEFQDINPLQQAILHLVSREADPARPGNLFAVGDVKQSIYRFRLAEPAIFTERLRRFSEGGKGTAIHLQSNFRSHPEILELVNFVFRRLIRPGMGELVYDASAELRPGRVLEANTRRHPVELHLLEQTWQPEPVEKEEEEEHDETVEAGVADPRDPARWTPIEREAYLIGTHIRDWMASGEHPLEGAALRYRDIAVLLRTAKVNAERMAAMFTFLGIPAYAEVGGSLFSAVEIRDVLAALQVLDNFQQDIPLASVLRSGIMGERLNEDELVEIRCLDREIPFHAVVREYARRGGDSALRERMRALLQRISRYREEARRRPPADLLWRLYEEHGYMGYAAGLINGVQRRANLLKFHQIARKFGTFRRQGLHRFLRFIESLQEEEQDVALAPSLGESDDVVRVMSIHQSKGLEFPMVFVAGLGTQFNFRDRQGRIIFERKSRIGLRVVDTQRMIEYPSAAHCLVADEIERTTREEELRILYTAMTRARDRLVLVGSMRGAPTSEEVGHPLDPTRPLSVLSIAAAEKPLDWLLASTCGAPESVFNVHTHDAEEMKAWRACDPKDEGEAKTRLAASRLEALPGSEPVAMDDPQVAEVLARIDFVYPHLSASSVRATMAASKFKGAYDFLRDPDERPDLRKGRDAFLVPPSKYSTQAKDPSVHRGVITHRVLQHLDFAVALDAAGVASELQRLMESGVIAAEDRSVVDEAGLTWFVSMPLAESIRRAGSSYTREFRFIAAEPLTTFDRTIDAGPVDRVLVRGIVDGILPTKDGLTLVDFKTDAISASEVQGRGERYRPQMTLYASAMAALWKRPVSAIWLVFLAPRQIIQCAADLPVLAENPSPLRA